MCVRACVCVWLNCYLPLLLSLNRSHVWVSSRFDENCSVCRLHLRKASPPLFASFLPPFSSRCFLWLSHVNVGVASITASMHRRGLTWLDFAMLLLSCLLLSLFTLLLCYLRRFCLFPLFLSVFQLSSSLSTLPLCVCALPVVYVCLSLSSILSRRFLILLLNSLLSLANFFFLLLFLCIFYRSFCFACVLQ